MLPTSDHVVPDWNPARGGIQLMNAWLFSAEPFINIPPLCRYDLLMLNAPNHRVTIINKCTGVFFISAYVYLFETVSYENKRPTGHGSLTIATAGMLMLCNIFPILSLQLMKGSSSEKFLILKKNVLFFLLSLFYHIWA